MNGNDDSLGTGALACIGRLSGPKPNAQFQKVVELVVEALPYFAKSALEAGIDNEKGLNGKLVRFINNLCDHKGFPYTAVLDSMEDETDGNSPAPDIGIHLKQDDVKSDLPKVTVFECKRLSTDIRHCEYVHGYEKSGKYVCCGGIERFKLGKHGRDFKCTGLIGYVQDGNFKTWLEKVNTWIIALSQQMNNPQWRGAEQLQRTSIAGTVMQAESIVYRCEDEMHLKHLWVDLTQEARRLIT